jgi:hypothetical protein
MPKAEEILEGLLSISNKNKVFAILWHVIFYLFIAYLICGYVLSNRIFGMLLALPLLSVATFAWMAKNPFNGILFTIMAILIFIFGWNASPVSISFSSFPFKLAGIFMIFFGLVYPHFIQTSSIIKYLYLSPAGIIPCPTLSVLTGFVILYNGFGSQPISLVFIVSGLFYSIFGTLRLKVYLDLFLLFGTLILLVKYIS